MNALKKDELKDEKLGIHDTAMQKLNYIPQITDGKFCCVHNEQFVYSIGEVRNSSHTACAINANDISNQARL